MEPDFEQANNEKLKTYVLVLEELGNSKEDVSGLLLVDRLTMHHNPEDARQQGVASVGFERVGGEDANFLQNSALFEHFGRD